MPLQFMTLYLAKQIIQGSNFRSAKQKISSLAKGLQSPFFSLGVNPWLSKMKQDMNTEFWYTGTTNNYNCFMCKKLCLWCVTEVSLKQDKAANVSLPILMISMHIDMAFWWSPWANLILASPISPSRCMGKSLYF